MVTTCPHMATTARIGAAERVARCGVVVTVGTIPSVAGETMVTDSTIAKGADLEGAEAVVVDVGEEDAVEVVITKPQKSNFSIVFLYVFAFEENTSCLGTIFVTST